MEALILLKKSKESLQSEALRLQNELEEVEAEVEATKKAIASVVQRVQDLDDAIKKLEKPDASKSKKVK